MSKNSILSVVGNSFAILACHYAGLLLTRWISFFVVPLSNDERWLPLAGLISTLLILAWVMLSPAARLLKHPELFTLSTGIALIWTPAAVILYCAVSDECLAYYLGGFLLYQLLTSLSAGLFVAGLLFLQHKSWVGEDPNE